MQLQLSPYRKIFFLSALVLAYAAGTISAQSIPALAENQLVLPAKTYSIPLYWKGDSVNGKWDPHAALLLPVRLKNCPGIFFMQFDTGAPSSLFYKNKLQSIRLKYPLAIPGNGTDSALVNFSFKAGRMPVMAKQIAVKQFDSTGINWHHKNRIEIIGTIGTDLIDNKVAIIDYPGRKLVIADSLPAALRKEPLSNFMYARRSILLPAQLKGNNSMLYFDSGSSMYELLTSKTNAVLMAAPGSTVITSKVKSWDNYLTANSIASNDSITISNKKIPVHFATYIEGVSNAQVTQMMQMGIGGLTGNKLFLQYRLVLDTKNKKFGLMPCSPDQPAGR